VINLVIEALRVATERNISENPLTISAQRTEFLQDASGGRTAQVSTLPPFQGRLVTTKQLPRASQLEAGLHQTVAGWVLIAPYTADLRWGSGVMDKFTAGGRSYRVVRVIVRSFAGATYALHALLEEVA